MSRVAKINRTDVVSFRLDPDLKPLTNEWMKKNHLNFSQLGNLAIREFVQKEHALKPVEIKTVYAKTEKVIKVAKRMMKKHADMLERLK